MVLEAHGDNIVYNIFENKLPIMIASIVSYGTEPEIRKTNNGILRWSAELRRDPYAEDGRCCGTEERRRAAWAEFGRLWRAFGREPWADQDIIYKHQILEILHNNAY